MEKLSLAEVAQVTGAEKNSDAEIYFDCVTTDSRKITGGALFVALKGEHFNGEDFAAEALRKGAAAVLVSKNFDKELDGKHITVEFLKKMRNEEKFDSLEDLSAQIVKDCEKAKAWFSER